MIIFKDKVHSDLTKLVEVAFKNGVTGASEQFMFNIDVYLRNAPTAANMYYVEGMRKIMNMTVKGKPAVKDSATITPMYASIFGMLEKHTFVGIDVSKEGYPNAIYTRNFSLLKELEKAGWLIPGVDLSKVEADLNGNKTALGFEENSYLVVRLDIASVIGKEKVLFKPVIPRSRVKIGVGEDWVFIPLDFMHTVSEMVNNLCKGTTPVKFVKESIGGPKTHVISCNPDVIKKVYANAPANLVNNRLYKLSCGYDDIALRYKAFDLESSIYSLGEASFRPEMLNSIKKGALKGIDTSMHDVNYDHVAGIFKTKVSKMKLADFDKFKALDTSSFPTVDKKAEAIMNMAEELSAKDLMNIMKSYPDIFGDMDSALQTRQKNSAKILKQLNAVTSWDLNLVKQMLYEGVLKITAISKSNKTYERYASNNEKVLMRFLGKDYVKKFESPTKRINHLKAEIASRDTIDKAELEKLVVEYDLLALVDTHELLKCDPIVALDNALNNVRSSSPMSSETILYHKLNATARDNLYGQVKLGNIIALEYAPYTEK